jgi:hypothetical protein
MQLSHLQFAKQFFLADQPIKNVTFSHWHHATLFNQLNLYVHPELLYTTEQSNKGELTLLGTIIDPKNPCYDNKAIVTELLASISCFTEFEKRLNRLGGRWLLIANTHDDSRIYHDAAGLKPVFYMETTEGLKIMASQPALLAALNFTVIDQVLVNRFKAFPNSQSWPLAVIPYKNVKQLLPNHYLKIENLTPYRFWPKSKRKFTNLEQVAREINKLLQGSVKALTNRNACIMSLTGGYDSRMLFSTTVNNKDNISFFTITSSFTPKFDIDIPTKIAKQYALDHSFSPQQELSTTDQKIIGILSENVGQMYLDRSMKNINFYAKMIAQRTHLPGSVSEIGRCYYFPYGKRLSKLTGESLARYCGFKGNPDAIHAYQHWFTSLPLDMPYDPLDLLYWEHRLGVWGSSGLTYREALIEQIPPMNNREFMALCLSVPIKDRLAPHKLIQQVIALNQHDLLNLPFNNENEHALFYQFPFIRRLKNYITMKINLVLCLIRKKLH